MAKRLMQQVYQWITGVRSNPVAEKQYLSVEKANSNNVGTAGLYIFGRIYIYIYTYVRKLNQRVL
jgi:hypothetical protein